MSPRKATRGTISTAASVAWVENQIARARALGINEAGLCDVAGVARSNIRRWLIGETTPGFYSRTAIETALRIRENQ